MRAKKASLSGDKQLLEKIPYLPLKCKKQREPLQKNAKLLQANALFSLFFKG